MAEEDDDGIFHDLGILFVHGIGQTGRSETLLRFGEPLRKCIEELVTPGRDSSAVSVSISAASLDPEPGKGPAHAELRISGAEKDSRWILAEAWWAKKFPTATFGEIASWCFKVVPWTLVAHFDRQFRRMGFRLVAVLDEGRIFRGSLLAVRWMPEALKLVMALTLLPLLLAVLLVLTLIGIVPFAPVRNFARSIQRVLAATLGDSFVLLDQPIIAAAITASVRTDLEWLAKRCRRVVVVAHSQGAAISHQVLRGAVTAPCNLFVTLGSGLAKLDEIRHISEQRGRKWLWLASGGAFLAALCLCGYAGYLWHGQSIWAAASWLAVAGLTTELGAGLTLVDLLRVNPFFVKTATEDTPPAWRYGFFYVLLSGALSLLMDWPVRSWLQPSMAAALAAGLAVSYVAIRRWQIASGRSLNKRSQWQRDRDFYRDHFQLRRRSGMRWFDFFASADAVPNGPLLDDFAPKDLHSCEVTNAHSVVTDHTSYWKNKDEFLPHVAKELLRIAGLDSRYVDLERVAGRRRWRMGWRVATRWILAFAAAALAARWLADRPPFLDALAKAFPASGFPLALLHNRPERLMPLVVTVLWALAAAVVLFFWRLWEAKEADAGISGEAYGWAGWRFITFLVLLCCCLCAGYWLAGSFPRLAGLGLFFGAAALVFLSKRARNWLVLVSQSGEPGMLRRLRTKVLTDEAAVAFEKENSSELTRVGLALLGLDDKLAIKALSQASDLGSVNAAWRLGLHFDVAADRAADAASRTALRQEAKKEFEKGMKLGDASCAWFLGSSENRDENIDGAIQAYRRAVELGDFSACSFLGRLLKSRDQEEAMRVLEEGARHNDGYSVNCLAYQLESQSRDLRQSKPDEFKALRQRAADLYRRAFDLGYTDAAFSKGSAAAMWAILPVRAGPLCPELVFTSPLARLNLVCWKRKNSRICQRPVPRMIWRFAWMSRAGRLCRLSTAWGVCLKRKAKCGRPNICFARPWVCPVTLLDRQTLPWR